MRYSIEVRITIEAENEVEADAVLQTELEAALLRDDSPLRSFTILPDAPTLETDYGD